MKKIAIFHYQVGGTDGVSLEIDKWKRVLEEMGHSVHLCGGDLGTAVGTRIPEMYHHTPEAERLYRNTFVGFGGYPTCASYQSELLRVADALEEKLLRFVREKHIDLLLPNNIWSVALNPPVAIALARVMRHSGIPTVAHHHDFYWERTGGLALPTPGAVELADKFLPPRDPLLRHVVINTLAQRELWQRKGIQSLVVPNVFDFDAPLSRVDDYNRDFRARIGLCAKDVLILQATRIVRRKGIELAIDFVRALDTPDRRAQLRDRGLYDRRPFDQASRIVLVLAGYSRDDVGGRYVHDLRHKIAQTGIDAVFIEDLVGAQRIVKAGHKTYSLWDTYTLADLVTYPSLWEGWGNQLLEALCARLPTVVFEYPVYQADIEDKGFQLISLGSQIAGRDQAGLVRVASEMIEAAADRAVDLLTNAELRRSAVEHNLQLARQHYSLSALRRYVQPLISL